MMVAVMGVGEVTKIMGEYRKGLCYRLGTYYMLLCKSIYLVALHPLVLFHKLDTGSAMLPQLPAVYLPVRLLLLIGG